MIKSIPLVWYRSWKLCASFLIKRWNKTHEVVCIRTEWSKKTYTTHYHSWWLIVADMLASSGPVLLKILPQKKPLVSNHIFWDSSSQFIRLSKLEKSQCNTAKLEICPFYVTDADKVHVALMMVPSPRLICSFKCFTLPETNSKFAPENRPGPKRKRESPPIIHFQVQTCC